MEKAPNECEPWPRLCSFTLGRHHEAEADDTDDLALTPKKRLNGGGGVVAICLGPAIFDHKTRE